MKADEARDIAMSKGGSVRYKYSSDDDFIREICLRANKGKRYWAVRIDKVDQSNLYKFADDNGYELSILHNPFWIFEYKLKIAW